MNSVINMASSSDECRFLDELKKSRVKITLSDTEITGVIQRVHPKKTVLLEDGKANPTPLLTTLTTQLKFVYSCHRVIIVCVFLSV